MSTVDASTRFAHAIDALLGARMSQPMLREIREAARPQRMRIRRRRALAEVKRFEVRGSRFQVRMKNGS